MDLATARFLLTPEGRRLDEEVAAFGAGAADLVVATRLRASYTADQVAAAMTQHRLRARAAEKFGSAAPRLFLTSDGLQQATHGVVARHRARRIAAAEPSRVVDLTCGIGSDLVALAQAGCQVVGVEQDAGTAAFAEANLSALELPGSIVVGTAEAYALKPDDVCFVDPARRTGAGRVFDPDHYSPTWSFVESLLGGDAAVKVAPGFPHERVPPQTEAEWVSLSGQLREAVIWSGRFASDVRRRATVMDGRGAAELTDLHLSGAATVAPVGAYVYEPDDAVVRAHLVEAFAEQVDGWLIDSHLAYVSGPDARTTPLGRVYRVVEVLPFKEKALRAALRARDIGPLTIKKRGIQVTPEVLRDRLRLTGSQPATLILTRTPRSAQALLVEPLSKAEAGGQAP